ncbi:anthocyanidin 3-O-glucosyltransferase 7-like [Pistacia vera]|uniref:anthocyanidin 3-O-glucosyltransferase 7-like n=1 Tax=Pistacia vera TaxID=55513 RepID=UPI00126380EC|nr:anthocyanidin 3-O-glucosyltransferase 7-like [Pistacia vera]
MPETKTSRKHIAVLAFPFGTHAAPLLSFVRRISEAASDVKFSFFNTAQSNALLFSNGGEFERVKFHDVESGLPDGYVFNKSHPNEPVEYFLKATPGNFERAMEIVVAETGVGFSCLISDAFIWYAAEMAEKRRVPWIPLWTSASRSLLVHLDTDNLRERLGINGPGEQTLVFFPGFSSIRAMDLPEGTISGPLDEGVPVLLHKVGQILPKAAAVASNSFEEIDLPDVNTLMKSRLPNFLNIGPFTLTSPPPPDSDKNGCLEWLEKREKLSVAYISFGSIIQLPPPELTALAEALEASKTPFLWSFRGNPKEQLPPGFLQRTSAYGKVVPWAPQLKILEHSSVGVFVTHGGWNSILESIIGGVPMICRPFFGDQKLNERTLETVWGIGLGVEGRKFTKGGAIKALEVILCSEQGKIMREKIAVLKQLAFQAVESEGSSTANFKTVMEVITKT